MTRDKTQDDLQRGTIFYDLNRKDNALLEIFTAEIRDGLGNTIPIAQSNSFINYTKKT